MKNLSSRYFSAVLLVLLATLSLSAASQTFHVLSTIDPGQNPPAGGCGDSWAPVVSPDGRYVLFASTANNLLHNTNNAAMPTGIPLVLNVFLRDRTSGTTTLVSVNLARTAGGNGNSFPVELSTNAQYVLFESSASDLVVGDTNSASDIFVRDMINGTTVLVSADTNGLAGNGRSRSATMTPDSRYVAFVSAANNLVAGDTNRIDDVFARDLQTGTTAMVSVGAKARPNGSFITVSSSEAPEITPDGRYIAFYSTTTNLVPGVPLGSDIYVRDLMAGLTIRASVYARTSTFNALFCFNHSISADGRFVAYEATKTTTTFGSIFRYDISSGLTTVVDTNAAVADFLVQDIHNLDMTPDGRFLAYVGNTNNTSGATTCVRRWDASTGKSILVSGDQGNQVPVNSTCDWPTIDPAGRFIAFLASPSNLTSNSLFGSYHVYLRDTQAATTILLDADTNGIGSPVSAMTVPRLSADARFAAFECADSTLVPDDHNHESDIFVRDLTTGLCELISARDSALPSATANGPSLLSTTSISADGRYVVFASEAENLVTNDFNGVRDVFVRDLISNATILVSAATNAFVGNGPSAEPVITPDGHYIAFSSGANNLVSGDINRVQDVFIRDLWSGTTTLVDLNSDGTGVANGASYSPSISQNGRFVLFLSKASNLTSGSFSGAENIFLRDLQTGTNYALTTVGGSIASMTPEGRFVVFIGKIPGNSTSNLYVWNTGVAARSYTNSSSLISTAAISPSGNTVAFWGPGSTLLHVADIISNTDTIIASNGISRLALSFSANGLSLAYVASLSGTNQVYVYNLQTGTSSLLSHSFDPYAAGFGDSDSPTISADGRFVAYRSAAPDLAAGITNELPQIFLYDRQTGLSTLIGAGEPGSLSPNNRSLMPAFSPDGGVLFFESWASDLVQGDFNHNSDVFSFPLLLVTILPTDYPSQAHWLSWSWDSTRNYAVQYNTNLIDSSWHDLSGTITNDGLKVYFKDHSPGPNQRFYRVLAF